ncbi:hypothetical protein EDD15DRAFT_2191474 [Pisolithus albus]|nr:hypothetical protein EDD15DRAFT_2191474 [Pisolithus albus]
MKCEQQLGTLVDSESCCPPLVDGYYFMFIRFPPTMTMDSVSATSPHIAPHRSHTLPSTAPLSSQVGGHASVQTTEDGSLLLKLALPRELEFYQLIRDGMSRDIDAAAQCILDVNLGTVLYDENAPPEKKERVIRTAASTTSFSTGKRLTGFQVYANAHLLLKLTSKRNTLHLTTSNRACRHILFSFCSCAYPNYLSVRVAVATAEVRIVRGNTLTICEGDWASAEKAARTSGVVSTLISMATASGQGLDGNAPGAPEEGKDWLRR